MPSFTDSSIQFKMSEIERIIHSSNRLTRNKKEAINNTAFQPTSLTLKPRHTTVISCKEKDC